MRTGSLLPALLVPRRRPAPTRPTTDPAAGVAPSELLEVVSSYREVPRPSAELTTRRYELLERSSELEVWAIHWPVGGGLELHDHGRSAGAFWVHRGVLIESSPGRSGSLTRRHVLESSGVAFGPGYTHDVVNEGPAMATSVHAYSPPLEAMTFFALGPTGLVATRTEQPDPAPWTH